MMRTMSSWRALLAVLATALIATLAATPAQAPASASITPMTLRVADTAVGAPTLAHARIRDVVSCGPYAACRTTPQEGVIRWTLTSKRDPQVRLHHRSVVADGSVRWRTPRLQVPGTWYVKAVYSGSDTRPASNGASVFRVTRR